MPLLKRHPKIMHSRSLPDVSREIITISENLNLDAQKFNSASIKKFLLVTTTDKM